MVPVDENNHEAEFLTFGEEYFSAKTDNRIRINTQSGNLLSITSYPAEQSSDIVLPYAVYPDMDSSFNGQEALYNAIKTFPSEKLQTKKDILLIGTNTLSSTEYAAIRCGETAYLPEYTRNQDGTLSILALSQGNVAESVGNFGYSMNLSNLSGKTLYRTTFADKHWATTADGKETDTSSTVPTDYTGFRFVWADLHQVNYPVTGSFFLAEVTGTIPPAIAIPIVGKTIITALGFNV